MGYAFSKHYYQITDDEIKAIKKETGFSTSHVKRLFNRFQHIDSDGRGYLIRSDFENINEIALNPMGDRLTELFFPNNAGRVYFPEFAKQFAVFRPVKVNTPGYAVNSRDAKLKFLYSLMDGNKDGKVDREDIFDVLELMMGAKVDTEQLNLIAARIIDEADTNHDGVISIHEFQKITEELEVGVKMSFISFR